MNDLLRHFRGWAAFLDQLGFTYQGEAKGNFLYVRGPHIFNIRAANQNGDLPEAFVNDGFDAAGLPVPRWPVHWCD